MPRVPIDHSKTIIYKLVCNDLNIRNVYVGSTTNMIERKRNHKSECNNRSSPAYNQKKFKIIRLNGGWNNWSMILIEYYPCTNKFEAIARERYYTELLNSDMNSQIPGALNRIGKVEYHKQYNGKYQEQHKEQIRAKQNVKFQCECGGCYTYVNKTVHFRTEKHQKYMEANYEWTYWWDDGTQCTEQDYNNTSHYFFKFFYLFFYSLFQTRLSRLLAHLQVAYQLLPM
jgi:predicted GIY-YIG superfamily endonuclease